MCVPFDPFVEQIYCESEAMLTQMITCSWKRHTNDSQYITKYCTFKVFIHLYE